MNDDAVDGWLKSNRLTPHKWVPPTRPGDGPRRSVMLLDTCYVQHVTKDGY